MKMNIDNISTQLLFTTLPIWVECKDGNNTFGTGFIFNYKKEENIFIPFLITNNHVIKSTFNRIITEFVELTDEGINIKDRIKIEISREYPIFFNEVLDITAIPIHPIIDQILSSNKKILYRFIDNSLMLENDQLEQLSAIEEITFIGYPNAMYDIQNMLPIVRKGITATPIWNNFDNDEKFLIDAGVYPGSGGSPVFIFNQGSYLDKDTVVIGNRLIFVGMISESVIKNNNKDNFPYFLGIGTVLKSKAIESFLDEIVKNQLK